MKNTPVVLNIAFDSLEEAQKIAGVLVAKRLVACAQLFPIQSIYRWDGKVNNDKEVFMQAKTIKENLAVIESLVKEMHAYDVPEMIATPIVWGHQSYMDWLIKHSSGKE